MHRISKVCASVEWPELAPGPRRLGALKARNRGAFSRTKAQPPQQLPEGLDSLQSGFWHFGPRRAIHAEGAQVKVGSICPGPDAASHCPLSVCLLLPPHAFLPLGHKLKRRVSRQRANPKFLRPQPTPRTPIKRILNSRCRGVRCGKPMFKIAFQERPATREVQQKNRKF